MPEAITKYAVNSTLGTDKFQPLDQMIVGQKMFVASGTPIAIKSICRVTSPTPVTIAKFIPQLDGTIQFSCTLEADAYSSPRAYLSIQEDGTKIFSSVSTGSITNVETILNIQKNKTYSFLLYTDSTATMATLDNFKLSGDIVDNNWFTFENYEI